MGSEMCIRDRTASELMQFLQAANWLRTPLPRMAEVVEPLRVFLEQLMAGASRRTKRVAHNRVIQEDEWTAERVRAWMACCAGFGGASGAALSSSSRVRRVDVS